MITLGAKHWSSDGFPLCCEDSGALRSERSAEQAVAGTNCRWLPSLASPGCTPLGERLRVPTISGDHDFSPFYSPLIDPSHRWLPRFFPGVVDPARPSGISGHVLLLPESVLSRVSMLRRLAPSAKAARAVTKEKPPFRLSCKTFTAIFCISQSCSCFFSRRMRLKHFHFRPGSRQGTNSASALAR